MKYKLLFLKIFLFTPLIFGQTAMTYDSLSQCILYTMKERELSGNHMFKVVKNECERVLGKEDYNIDSGSIIYNNENLFDISIEDSIVYANYDIDNFLDEVYIKILIDLV